MQKVRKLVTTIMIAALITAMEGTTILPLSHHVKADTNTVSQTSQAENDLTKYKKITPLHSADFWTACKYHTEIVPLGCCLSD